MAETNPFTLLKQDHQTVAKLFRSIEQTSDRAEETRQELFDALNTALEQHTQVEEEYLYPLLEKAEVTHEASLEAQAEHDVVKTLLAELAVLDQHTDEWLAKLAVMRGAVERHVQEEETVLFPHATQVMSEAEQQDLANEILEQRRG